MGHIDHEYERAPIEQYISYVVVVVVGWIFFFFFFRLFISNDLNYYMCAMAHLVSMFESQFQVLLIYSIRIYIVFDLLLVFCGLLFALFILFVCLLFFLLYFLLLLFSSGTVPIVLNYVFCRRYFILIYDYCLACCLIYYLISVYHTYRI